MIRAAISARAWRITALIAPPALVMLVVRGSAGMLRTASLALVALWITMCGALIALAHDGGKTRTPFAARIDVLTPTGAAMMWSGAGALVLATVVGWASLAVVGVLGMGAVFTAVTWLALVTGSNLPWRRAKIERAIVPALALEGDPLRDEIHLSGVGIPPGMRLFVTAHALRHGPKARHVVDSVHSRAELELSSELGPAPRGDHKIPPVSLWLGDVFGLARTAAVHRAETELLVLPRPLGVDQVPRVLAAGGDSDAAVPAPQLPTEGAFRVREYVDGDDTRRIHWVRSLQQDRLVVRLPDEIPPAEPAVRLVLDNDLPGGSGLTCRAADEMLDTLVRVWLGIGSALSERGTRVTLVAAVGAGDAAAVAERGLGGWSSRDAAVRLGARVSWQGTIPLAAIVGAHREARQIIVSCRPRRMKREPRLSWVVVPDLGWTTTEAELLPPDRELIMPFPSGSADNRHARRDRERALARARWEDRSMFGQVACWVDWTRFSGDVVARPARGRAVLEVIP